LYRLCYETNKPPKVSNQLRKSPAKTEWGSTGKDAKYLSPLHRLLGKIDDEARLRDALPGPGHPAPGSAL
jgi:hypothetical protein